MSGNRFSYLLVLLLAFSIGNSQAHSDEKPRLFDATAALRDFRLKHDIPLFELPADRDQTRKELKGTVPKIRQLGEMEVFWIVDFTNFTNLGYLSPNEDKTYTFAELARISPHAYLYVEMGLGIDSDLLDQMVSEFESAIYGKMTPVFGMPPDALDEDPRVTILIATFLGTSMFGATAAGYFDDANQYTDSEAFYMNLGHSNEQEMIYINKDFVTRNMFTNQLDPLVLGLFAHEYQHMLHWARDPVEDVWINEGCSEYAMFLSEFDDTTDQHKEMFAISPTDSLTSWDNTLSQYGGSYFFMRYLGDHYGGNSAIEAITSSQFRSLEGIHSFLQSHSGVTFPEVFHNWGMANMLDTSSGDYSYSFEKSPPYWRILYESVGLQDLMPIFFTLRLKSFNVPEFEAFLPVWTHEYYLLQRAAGEAGQPFHGTIEVDGDYRVRVTYAALQQVGSFPDVTYNLLREDPVQLSPQGFGTFNIPGGDNHAALIISCLSSGHGPSITNATMTYRIQTFPGAAGALVQDVTAPAGVDDLSIESIVDDRMTLSWTAPGDDGMSGMANLYDMRYSTEPLTPDNFATGIPVRNLAFPRSPGTVEQFTPPDLPAETTLHFLLKIEDDAGHTAWSNSASGINGPADIIPPASITDLRIQSVGNLRAALLWSAPGDDGVDGTAKSYDFRWSLTPITTLMEFRQAQIVPGPNPAIAGTPQSVQIDEIPEDTEVIYAALRTIDDSGNVSGVSNVVQIPLGTSAVSEELWGLYK